MLDQSILPPDTGVYKTLLESTKAIPWKINWDSKRFEYIGPQIEMLLGWPQASWTTAQDWIDRIHPDDRERVVTFCIAQSELGADHEADYRALKSDGGYVWIRDVVHVVRKKDGTADDLIGFMFDISERKKTEDELADLRRTLEGQVEQRTSELRDEMEKRALLERQVLQIAEEERRRVGYELHDDLGQRLTGVSLLSEVLYQGLCSVESPFAEAADRIQRAVAEAISQTRALAHGLIPVGPGPEGFREALSQLARESSTGQTSCSFVYDEPVDVKSADVATNLYRIAQETLTNSLRHAKAKNIVMRLDMEDGRVVFTAADDGIGRAGVSEGRGLEIMAYRASLINYEFDIQSTVGRGTRVRVSEAID